jgi:hypothetical protein
MEKNVEEKVAVKKSKEYKKTNINNTFTSPT